MDSVVRLEALAALPSERGLRVGESEASADSKWRALPRVLLPLASIVLGTFFGAGFLLWQQEQEHLVQEATARGGAVLHEFRTDVASQAAALSMTADTLSASREIRNGLRAGDARALLAFGQPIMHTLSREHGLVYSSFHGGDGRTLAHIGDQLEADDTSGQRVLRAAMATGRARSGIELSSHGIPKLSVSTPVFEESRVLGYAQIGKSILPLLQHRVSAGVEIALLVRKERLLRPAWKNHSATGVSWESLPHVVVAYASDDTLALAIGQEIARRRSASADDTRKTFAHTGHDWWWISDTLHDVGNGEIGELLVLIDVTAERQKFNRVLTIGGTTGSLLLLMLLGFILHLLVQSKRRSLARQRVLNDLLKFHQDLIDSVPSPIFYKNTSGLYEGGNRAFEGFLGLPREQFIGKSVFEVATPELAERYAAADRALFANPGVQTYQGPVTYADGSQRDVVFHKATYTNSQGEVTGMIGLISDISEMKAAERAMTESRNLLLTVIDTVPARVYWKDRDLRYLGCNRFFAADLGLEHPNAVIGRSDGELANQAQAAAPDLSAEERAVIATGAARLYVEQARTAADGRTIWLRHSIAPLRNAESEVIGLLGVFEDITERKAAEEKLARNEHLQRAAIEAADEAFAVFDQHDRLVFSNRKFRDVHAPVSHLVVPGVAFDTLLSEWVRHRKLSALPDHGAAWLTERRRAYYSANGQFTDQLDDGRRLRIVERRAPDGHTVGFYVDVTQLHQAREAAEAASAVKSTFLATMSHELRTPMNGILGMLELVVDSELSAEQRDRLETAQNSARLLLTLLNQILDFSKIEADKMDLEAVPFNLPRLVRETVRALERRALDKGLAVSVNIDDDVPAFVVGDPTRLRQVITNLFGNAAKFTERGQIGVELTLLALCDNEVNLRFSVRDTGVGIPPEKMASIFDPFAQADVSTSRRFGGTGLGLAICRRLVGLMGGSLAVDSELGRGSVFHFSARFGRTTQAEDDDSVASPAGADQLQPGLRVLLAEDNPTNQKFVRAVLDKAGCHVALAQDGAEAVQMAGSRRFDVILMDVEMPRLDGFAATRALRERGIEAPIVGLTAHAIKGFREQCLQAGMNDYLSKPIRGRDLRARLAEIQQRLPANAAAPAALSAAADAPAAVPAPADEPAVTSATPVFDQARALEMMDGDRDGLLMMLALVRDQARSDGAAILTALEAADPPSVKTASHRLKSSLGQIGAVQAWEICAALEAAAAESSRPKLAALARPLRAALSALDPEISAYLAAHAADSR